MSDAVLASNRQTAVQDWLRANPEPLQELCPEVNQYWRGKRNNETYVTCWSSRTGKRTEYTPSEWTGVSCGRWETITRQRIPPVIPNTTTPRDVYYGFYVRYIKELDALEFARVALDGRRGIDGVKKQWAYASPYDRAVICPDDAAAYTYSGKQNDGKYYSHYLYGMISACNHDFHSAISAAELKKFAPSAKLETRYCSEMENPYPWLYAEWYTKMLSRGKSKTLIALQEYQLDDEFVPEKPDGYVPRSWADHVAFFEGIDDKYAVLRIYRVSNYGGRYSNGSYTGCDKTFADPHEDERVFISASGKPTRMEKICNEWRITSKTGSYWNCAFLMNPEAAQAWAPLRYVLPVVKDKKVDTIISVLRHPVVEQLSKAGYPKLADALVRDGEVFATMRDYFGVEKEKKLPINKLLGVNRHVLSVIENAKDPLRAASQVKSIFGRFDVSDVSKESMDLIAPMFANQYGVRELLGKSTAWYSARIDYISDEDRELLFKILRMERREPCVMGVWRDTLRILRQLNDAPDVDLKSCRYRADVVRVHDALLQLKLQQDRERQASYDARRKEELEQQQKQFAKLQEGRIQKYEYENDTWCVRVPKSLDEITMEGMALGHCVGGYVAQHAKGDTNILFLRRRNQESVSFFTIEIRNDVVIQIHGNHNRWLGNVPEAVPFMYEYLTQLGVKFDKMVLLNKGAGYSPSSESLPESALHAQ